MFYINILNEINESIDDRPDNSKLLIIQRAASDSTVLPKKSFNENNYAIQEIIKEMAVTIRKGLAIGRLKYAATYLFMHTCLFPRKHFSNALHKANGAVAQFLFCFINNKTRF